MFGLAEKAHGEYNGSYMNKPKVQKTGKCSGFYLFLADEDGKYHEIVFDEFEKSLFEIFLNAIHHGKIQCVEAISQIKFGKHKIK